MTTSLTPTPLTHPATDARSPARSLWRWLWPASQLLVGLALTGAALVYLLWPSHKETMPTPGEEAPTTVEAVRLVGPALVSIAPDTPLGKKLEVSTVRSDKVSAPLLTVTGSVVAHLRSGNAPVEDRWQFATPELLTAFTDWRKSNADVELAEKQLTEIRELTADRITTQKKVVERLRKLVDSGTSAPKELDAEEGTLRQATIQGRKDIIEAETAVRVAARNRAGLERLLSQAGADPHLLVPPRSQMLTFVEGLLSQDGADSHLLGRMSDGMTMVVADVPEAKVGLVREGQTCQARFYALPGKTFTGKVSSLAPTISKERRTLRVLFQLGDPEGRLKPGMFADVGLGTDSREALLAPTDGVLHVGLGDYMFVGDGPGVWRITEVRVGEVRGLRVEILQGVKAGDKVLGKGAILLKPFVVQAVQGPKTSGTGAATPTGEKSAP